VDAARCWPADEWQPIDLPASLRERAAQIRRTASDLRSYALFAAVGGRVVVENGSVAQPVTVQSVRKALMNALIGRAVADSRLSLDATMADLEIDDLEPALTHQERRATVLDCLMGRSGIYHQAAYEPSGLDARRPARGSHAPGEYWFYNNWDFNVLATILRRAAGLDAFRVFDEWFARPMRMQDFEPSACRSVFEPVSSHPAYLFTISARDLARFGHLHLCNGLWHGDRLLAEEWIAASWRPLSPAAHGYEAYATAFGRMWWVMRPELFGGLRSYAALGGAGHGLFVIPDLGAVVVHQNDGEATSPNWGSILPLLGSVAALCQACA